jgi:glutathionylspermidine synthase
MEKVEAVGFSFHSRPTPYWREEAYYAFSEQEIALLESVTNELHQMCLQAVDYIVDHDLFERMGVHPRYADWIAASWRRRDRGLYGRFDFCYDGHHPPRLLEYNADTPTILLESSVVQWYWLQDVFPQRDQFNLIHELLLERWEEVRSEQALDDTVYFTGLDDHEEDFVTVQYMRDLAIQAGCDTQFIDISTIGLHTATGRFVDEHNRPIVNLFKLYPWEWLFAEQFGPALMHADLSCVLEPPWKALLSTKALLPLLWELYPQHPNLLPASFEPQHIDGPLVCKPLFGREGEGIVIVDQRKHGVGLPETSEPLVYQAFAPLPCFHDNYPMIGSWVIGDTAAGMGIRESSSLITNNTSYFVPHCFE